MSTKADLTAKAASLEKQLIDIKKCMHEMNIKRTFAELRANNLEDEMALVQKENINLNAQVDAQFDDLTDQINTLKQEKDLQSVNIFLLEKEKIGLQNIIKDYEDKLYKRGHTAQTYFLNKPKEFKSYNDKEGLGFVCPHYLLKGINLMPTLYDHQYMRYGLTQNFVRVSDEEREIEEFNRSKTNNIQISFNYDNLNDSYNTRKTTFSDDYFPSYSQEELNQKQNGPNVVLEQVIFQKPYVPTLVLEKRISDLELELKHKNKVLQSTTKEFENKIEKLNKVSYSSDSKIEKQPSHILRSPKSNVVKIGKLDKHDCDEKVKSASVVQIKLKQKADSKVKPKRLSQFTNYSAQKQRKSFSNYQQAQKVQVPKEQIKQVWKPKANLSTNTTKSFKYSFSKLFELAPRQFCLDVQKVNDFVRHTPPVFHSPLIPRVLFRNETPSVKSQWNSTSLNQIDTTYKWISKVSKTIGPVLKWVPKVVSK